MTEVLKIEGLSAGYGPLRVIHDLDLVIQPGERIGIVGLNGHGKTTLFYAIAGLTGWQRGSILLNGRQIGIVACSVAMLILVVAWMKSSRRGLEIRAMMMNPHAAAIVGIGVRRTGFYVMGLTGAMAGLASVLLSQTYYIAPFSGLTPLIKGVSIALCGGLGSVQGAVIAAILLGLVEALTNKFLGGQYVLMTQFLVIIAILIVRPRGISGIVDKAREQ